MQELINNRIVLNSEDIEVFKSPNSWKGALEAIISICSRKNKDVGLNITPFIFDNPTKGESTKLTDRKRLRDFKSDSSQKKNMMDELICDNLKPYEFNNINSSILPVSFIL